MEKTEPFSAKLLFDGAALIAEEIVETMHIVADVVVSVSLMFFLTVSLIGIPLVVIYSQEFKDDFTWILNGKKENQVESIANNNLDEWEDVSSYQIDKRFSVAIEQINGTDAVKTQGIQSFCEALEINGNSSKYAYALLANLNTTANLFIEQIKESEDSTDRLIFIPVILEKSGFHLEDHNVVFAIDRTNGTIEYYDPKGVKIEDENQRKVKNLGISAYEFQQKISQKFDLKSISSNEVAHQGFFDGVNCGRFVCHFMKIRETCESLAAFNAIQLPDIQSIKKVLVDVITTAFPAE